MLLVDWGVEMQAFFLVLLIQNMASYPAPLSFSLGPNQFCLPLSTEGQHRALREVSYHV